MGRRHRLRRWGAVAASAALVLVPAGHAAGHATSHGIAAGVSAATLPLPSNAGPYPNPYVNEISCTPLGCVGVGYYTNTDDGIDGLIETEVGGAWAATKAPVPADAAPGNAEVEIEHVACPTVTSCVATGQYYLDGWVGPNTVVDTETDGVWTAQTMPSPASRPGPGMQTFALACPAPGTCYATGNYTDTPWDSGHFIATLSNGTWSAQTAREAVGGFDDPGELHSLSCATKDFCAALGDGANPYSRLAQVVVLTDGSWHQHDLPMARSRSVDPWVDFTQISCGAVGKCVAVGSGLIDSLSGGSWSSIRTPLPDGVTVSGVSADIAKVSCPSGNWCMAIGTTYHDPNGTFSQLAETFDGDSWHPTQLQVPNDVGTPTPFDISAFTCPEAGQCALMGPRSWSVNGNPAYYALYDDGGWTSSPVAPPAEVARVSVDYPMSLGCSTARNCVGVFRYYDGVAGQLGATVAIPGGAPLPSFAITADRSGGAAAYLYRVGHRRDGWQQLGKQNPSSMAALTVPGRGARNTPLFIERRKAGVFSRTLSSSWHRFAPGSRCLQAPAALPVGGYVLLACEGSDHALLVLGAVAHHGRLRPATKWSSLGGHLRAAPAVAVSHGAATLFVAGRHHRLLERTLTSGYHRVETGCFGAPAAATAPNRASSYLACKQRNGAIRVWTNVGTGWEIAQHLTARTLGNPVLAATNSGPVVAAEFTDHRVWVHDSQGWRSLAGAIRQGVAATGLN